MRKHKYVALFVLLSIIVTLCGCGSNGSTSASSVYAETETEDERNETTDYFENNDLEDESQEIRLDDYSYDEILENSTLLDLYRACYDVDDDMEWDSTPDSSCFSEVGYSYAYEILAVVFRNSGEEYWYYDFSRDDWEDFMCADSLGSYYNTYIKGQYECEKN